MCQHDLTNSLKLELSEDKTLVTHAMDKARFLGYDVTVSKPTNEYVWRNGARWRRPAGVVKLYLPKEKWVNNLLEKGILWIRQDSRGKESWMPVARSSFVNRRPMEIVAGFNSEIRGLYNYYSLASNVSVLSKYRYVMEYSMYKTFACKYRCTMTQAKLRYFKNGVFSIPYAPSTGIEKRIEFYHQGFPKKRELPYPEVDELPKSVSFYKPPSELIVRLLKGKCELCGNMDDAPVVHQVGILAELTGSTPWEIAMKKMRRKTLVVCHNCYEQIQAYV